MLKADWPKRIEDLESRNGTVVNGMPITKQLLSYGDRIQIGSSLLLFAHHDPMEEQVAQRRKLEAIGRLGVWPVSQVRKITFLWP